MTRVRAGRILTVVGTTLALGLPGALVAQAAVVGVVRDSLTGRRLAGATVQLVLEAAVGARARTVDTDSAGAFRIPDVAAGRYLITFLHPRLDSLGFEAPTRALEVPEGAGEVRADLALPGARTLFAALCGARRDTTGVLIGRVLDAASGEAVATGAVVVRWAELRIDATGVHREMRSVRAPVLAEGRYAACGVPADVPVAVQATSGDGRRPAGASGAIELKLDPAAPLVYRDLLTSGSVAAAATAATPNASDNAAARPAAAAVRGGTARVAGRVRRPDGSPLAGARVVVRGTGAADSVAVSDAGGAFRLDALPGGTYPIEAIAIGFTPARAAVDLRPGQPAAVDLAVGKRVASLERVNVYAAAPRANSEFAQHMRSGAFGRFVTAADIERRGALTVGDALMMVPGLHVGASSLGRSVIVGRGRCTPTVYLDGMRLQDGATEIDNYVTPSEIGGIEVYADAMTAPAQYGRGSCASVVIWTKGTLR